jgi:hypothetical protein
MSRDLLTTIASEQRRLLGASSRQVEELRRLFLQPKEMRRLFVQAEEMRRLFAQPLQGVQEAVKGMSAIGLRNQRALDGLKAFTQPNLELLSSMRASSQWSNTFSEMRAEIERQASIFRNIGITLARALEVPPFLRSIQLPTAAEWWQAAHQRFVRAAESLGRAGWPFSMSMVAADVIELAEQDGGPDAATLDDWFLEYYHGEDGLEFRALASRLLRRKSLATWRALLRECLWAYRRGKYRLAIPALLTTIEGLVCEVTGTIREKGVNPSRHWRARFSKPPRGLVIEVEWCAVTAFLESLWCRYDFDCVPPDILNRHWVAHGRRPEVGGRADALRLLAAVDLIAAAATGIKKLAQKREKKSA